MARIVLCVKTRGKVFLNETIEKEGEKENHAGDEDHDLKLKEL